MDGVLSTGLRLSAPARVWRVRGALVRVAPTREALARVSRFSGALVCAAALSAGQARAQSQKPPATPQSTASGESAGDLRGWLARIRDAAARSNYVGTFVNSTGTSVASSRVGHYFEGKNTLERVDALDGEPRSMLRVNGEVRTLWPRGRAATACAPRR